MNGCTGSLRLVDGTDFDAWQVLVRAGGLENTPIEAAEQTIGKHLHCVELWMPGGCNLRCRHCYVATRETMPVLAESDFYHLTLRCIKEGFIDVVVPGMEPLLRDELWSVLDAAGDGHARSVGMTTNATLLTPKARRLHESSLTVLNVSLDGPEGIHDQMRGRGVYKRLEEGVRSFRDISDKRILTNTTVNAENAAHLTELAEWCLEREVDYAAFHPFEVADEAENSLAVSRGDALNAYLRLFGAFRGGRTSSIVLEAEASTCWLILDLARSGAFDDSQLVIDEAGLIFLRETAGDRELLVGLNFYPHHFIRTIRITDSGGLASCRSMARTGWSGIGDVRQDELSKLVRSAPAIQKLAHIWQEYQDAVWHCEPEILPWFVAFIKSRLGKQADEFRDRVHPQRNAIPQLTAT